MKTLCAVILFALMACNHTERQTYSAPAAVLRAPESVESVAYELAPMNAPPDDEYVSDRILKTAHLRFQVDSVEKTSKVVEAITLKYDGIVADQSISNAANEITNRFTLRVPVSVFEKTIEELCKQAIFIDTKKITCQNVTEEYQDIQVRLKTKRDVRDRYTEILKTKAKTVEDILKAEEHIRVLQEEIESREGRLHFLKSRTAMSEISLQIYQKVVFTETPSLVEKPFFVKITYALENGWSFVMSSMLFVITCWPVAILCLLILWAWRKFKRGLQAKEALEGSVE